MVRMESKNLHSSRVHSWYWCDCTRDSTLRTIAWEHLACGHTFFLSCFKQYSFIKRWFLTYTTWKISCKVIFSGYSKTIKLETLAAQSPHAHVTIIWNWGAATSFWWDMSFPAILVYLSLISSVLNPKSFDTHISLLLISKYFKISFLIPNFKFNLLFNVWVIWECDFFPRKSITYICLHIKQIIFLLVLSIYIMFRKYVLNNTV